MVKHPLILAAILSQAVSCNLSSDGASSVSASEAGAAGSQDDIGSGDQAGDVGGFGASDGGASIGTSGAGSTTTANEECPTVDQGAGHDDFDGRPYDILNYNCHSAANAGVRNDPLTTGVLICGGAPDQGSPEHHTFNYRVEGGRTTFFNWGDSCETSATAIPPDVYDDRNVSCIAKFCDNQFNWADQRALDPGELVEEPGPNYCAETTGDRTSCDSCCQSRGTHWDSMPGTGRPTDSTFTEFMTGCYNACSTTFGF